MKKLLAGLMAAAILLCSACGSAPAEVESTQEPTDVSETVSQETGNSDSEQEYVSLGRSVKIDGETWRYNSSLKTVLFLGVDSREQVEYERIMGSGGRSDTMIIFIINTDTQTISLMPISRDTIAKVDLYNSKREYITTAEMQITMQYAFGDCASRSCWLSKKAVTTLLHDLPINYCCSLTLDGVSAAVELAGGITLTLEEDWTDIDPSYTAGSTITMDATQVESFLRYRDSSVFGSNNDRMRRQSWFIKKLFEQMGKLGSIGTDALLSYIDPYLESDMDADTIKQLTTYTLSDEIITIPGADVEGEYNDQFYVDDAALQELLLQTFYQKAE